MTHAADVHRRVAANVPLRQVGRGLVRTDAPGKAEGRTRYAGDHVMPDMLHAKVLRSPHAHARIAAIDDSRARALPGVHAVLHYGNTPRVKYASGVTFFPAR